MSDSACGCGSRYTEWRDCERHENDCYVLMCYTCGTDDYDCETALITERETTNVQS